MAQINFTITLEKEQELIKFIANECDSKVLCFGEPQKAEWAPIFISTWLILPNSIKVGLEHQESGMYKCSDDFYNKYIMNNIIDTNMYIRYERCFYEDEPQRIIVRFHLFSIPGCSLPVTKDLYKKLNKWVKKNSVETDRSEGIAIYKVE